MEEELALGLADALQLAGLDLGAAEDLPAAEIGVEELALALQLAFEHVHWLALAAAVAEVAIAPRVGSFARARNLRIVKMALDRRAGEARGLEGSGWICAGTGSSSSRANLLDSRESGREWSTRLFWADQ